MDQKPTHVVPSSKWIPEKLFQAIQKNVPIPCIDLMIIREASTGPEVLLIKRSIFPETGKWCLIGGRILKDELTAQAIRRQAKEELGVEVSILRPFSVDRPFAVYNDPISDIQKHFVVLTFPVAIRRGRVREKGPEFSEVRWFPLDNLPRNIGFHHKKALRDFLKSQPTSNS